MPSNPMQELQSALRALERATGYGVGNSTRTSFTYVPGFTEKNEEDGIFNRFQADLLGRGLSALLGQQESGSLFTQRNITSFTRMLAGNNARRTSRGQQLARLASILGRVSGRYS